MGRHRQYHSRPHSKEEKKKGKKRSKKNRWEKKNAVDERRLVDLVKAEVLRDLQEKKAAKVPLADAPKMPSMLRGAQMVKAANKRKVAHGDTSKIPRASYQSATRVQPQPPTNHPVTDRSDGKRLSPRKVNLDCLDSSSEFIAAGTFGKCFLSKYLGFRVVTKEVASYALAQAEAKILESLPDHRSLPYLFGITPPSKDPPLLVMKFHGEIGRPLTLHEVIHEGSPAIGRQNWKAVLADIVSAVSTVHKSGYLHNDIKSNNILLEKTDDDQYKAVLIDFGKSRTISAPKKYNLDANQRDHYRKTFKHIAPELLKGHPQSFQSDTFSLGMVFKLVASKVECMKDLKELSKACTSTDPVKRPSLHEIGISLQVTKQN